MPFIQDDPWLPLCAVSVIATRCKPWHLLSLHFWWYLTKALTTLSCFKAETVRGTSSYSTCLLVEGLNLALNSQCFECSVMNSLLGNKMFNMFEEFAH